MRISRVAKLEKELTKRQERKRSVFPQIRCDAEFMALVKKKKEKRHLTWERVVTEMGLNWLKQ